MMADTLFDVRDVDMSTGVAKRKFGTGNVMSGGVDRQHKRIAKQDTGNDTCSGEEHCKRNSLSIARDSRGVGAFDEGSRGNG